MALLSPLGPPVLLKPAKDLRSSANGRVWPRTFTGHPGGEPVTAGFGGKPIPTQKGGLKTMTPHRNADAAELFALESRFPFATTFISLFLVANVGSAILMLIGQA